MTRAWKNWTLLRQLVVGVSVLVMIALVSVGTTTVMTLRSAVVGIIDSQLSAATDAGVSSVAKYRSTPLPDGRMPAPGSMKPLTALIGQAPGNVVALIQDGRVVDSAYFGDGEAQTAPPAAVEKIAAMSWMDPQPQTVEIPELGWYRMAGRPNGGGEVLVTGVSRAAAWDAMIRETAIVVGITALALALTALCTVGIVRFALRPLRRVAATAAEVTGLPLDRDNHAITPRVPEGDTDPSTEVGLVGDTLNQLLDHVERALADVAASDRRMRQFITDASHELRTPLAAIHGYAELTRQDSSVLPETTEYSLARIEAEAQRMHTLVADLLLLARLDEGQDRHHSEVDLGDLVVDAVNDAAVCAPGHRWQTSISSDDMLVRGDRSQLHQMLTNLLSNARVHTPPGTTVTTTVVTSAAARGIGYAEVTVLDDGPGIDTGLLPHLFERFVRADKSRSRQNGSFGLGLSIVASIVATHGGTIDVTSRPGATSFRIRLPTVAVSVAQPVPT
ncbi:HAMP domain-containing sensor histidine kinase [Mycobacterium sp. SMC-4]|uniref:sensor histidine kinase n=1 Tax=Mycobacterium sp. SMC-4 TaxID=2857059 RepID=UPI0021B2AF2B|nr:HAMP domain-containing sensor histidine kinase [Mycobacterium sp. SMC-4]UXA19888.1 HAMP domain-containing histidine kinase [Mycobacterium sp. SMC-4]